MDKEMVMNQKDEVGKAEETKFKIKYGHFSPDGKEYIITRYDTPAPWINIMCNGDYGMVLSQTGSGFSFRYDANLSRINRWVQDLVTDEYGKYIYIKDVESNKFWSLGYKPVCPEFDEYKVTYGIGYSKILSVYEEIESEVTFFVPPKEPIEIWKINIKNLSGKKRFLDIFTYLEFCLGNANDIHREFQKTFIQTKFNEEKSILFGRKRRLPVPDFISTGLSEYPIMAFHSSNITPESFETDKANFIGNYRNLQAPKALLDGKLTNTSGMWYDSVASLKIKLELEPGEMKTLIFTLGSTEREAEAEELVERYKDAREVDKSLDATIDFWTKLLEKTLVSTPDEAFNFMTNWWLKYQAICGRLWARTAYYQSSGAYGFRDQLQDSLCFLPLEPELTKKQIILHARQQFKDGSVHHWWHEVTQRGVKTKMTDDLLWLVFLILEYIDETNDISILESQVEYVDAPKESLYQHCIKAIDLVLSRFSKRGLPLIGEGDWNDGMSAVGLEWKGESIWLGHYLYGILLRFSEIIETYDKERVERYIKRAEELKEKINSFGWDGKWFIRAIRDDGMPIGSAECEEGKIFLNAQTWAIINDIAPENRAKLCMDSCEKILFRDYGPLLFYPGYTVPDESIGYLSRYAPGLRENGGVYTHGACWAIIAEAKLKRADKAYEVFSKLCPINRAMSPDIYKAEPYVTAGNSDGPQSPHFGRGGWSWYSGSATWLFKTGLEWILGIRPTRYGLLIEPCIPNAWDKFKVKRTFRGHTYIIEVENPDRISYGIKSITLDGKKLSNNLLPAPTTSEKMHKVKVILGRV